MQVLRVSLLNDALGDLPLQLIEDLVALVLCLINLIGQHPVQLLVFRGLLPVELLQLLLAAVDRILHSALGEFRFVEIMILTRDDLFE